MPNDGKRRNKSWKCNGTAVTDIYIVLILYIIRKYANENSQRILKKILVVLFVMATTASIIIIRQMNVRD